MSLGAAEGALRDASDPMAAAIRSASRGGAPGQHADLVARAVGWLRHRHSCGTVFAEMSVGTGEFPDAVGWHRGLSRVVEVKVSRADFFADRRKPHAAHAEAGMGQQRWYLVPDGLVRADEAPEWCGLAYAKARRIIVVKEAPDRARYDHRGEALLLTSAVRRFTVGSTFDGKTGRFETLDARLAREADAAGVKRRSGETSDEFSSRLGRVNERFSALRGADEARRT